MRDKPYPEYCPAGALPLHQIPCGWKVKRGRFLMQVNPRPGRLSALAADAEVSFVPMEAVGEYGGLRLDQTRTIDEIGTGYTAFEDGDVVVAKITPCFENGKGALANGLTNGMAFGTTELHVLRARPELDRRYLFYLSTSQLFRDLGEGEMYGAGGQKRVPPDFCRDFGVPLPPQEQQAAIATFLDRETARIDALVEKRRTLIERLNEKRSALISQTVTRGLPPEAAKAAGLNPHPRMKDSGVEWLGEVPEHWAVRRLKDVGNLYGGAGFPHEYQGQLTQELPFYKVGDLADAPDGRTLGVAQHSVSRTVAGDLRARVIPQGAVVYAKIGAALLLNRRRLTPGECCIDNNMTAYVPCRAAVTPSWAFYCLGTIDFAEFMNPGAVPSFSEGYQATLPILCPPIPEQAELASFLDQESTRLDGLVTKVQVAIGLLTEYRGALITAAVTGKIDVRGAAA